MSYKRVFGFSVAILIVFLLIMIIWLILYSQERSRVDELRNQVFCEQIMPGMSLSGVRQILSKHGKFTETESSFKGGLVAVGISFVDPIVSQQFGRRSILLVFENGKYTGAREPIPFSDSYRSLCQ